MVPEKVAFSPLPKVSDKLVIDAEKTGKLPSAAQTKLILQIQKKINDEGIF